MINRLVLNLFMFTFALSNLHKLDKDKIIIELPPEKKELITFQNRLKKHKEYLLELFYRHEVPLDNNASERAIRNIKIKQKIYRQFNSTNGAFRFAVLRSITDTVLKNKLNILESLDFIANLQTD